MMLVGDRDRFAIEYELEAVPGGDVELRRWMFGRIRWWCGGTPVGRYDSTTAIGDLAAVVERLLKREDARISPELMDLPAPEVAHIITRALFSDDDRSDAEIAADGAHYWPFFVSPRTEVFDPWDVFVIEGEKSSRLIWGLVDRPELDEFRLHPGEFAEVLHEFLDALQRG
ncbi:Imm42 family immunity protein [Nocardia sp. NPDC051030]|uniref:Imm42 family immunity protein n=1 Tax=Nocardia sp. NPDC051030 TaxID=3155162 RepID=UPI003417EA6B